jgi:hypothetical protein
MKRRVVHVIKTNRKTGGEIGYNRRGHPGYVLGERVKKKREPGVPLTILVTQSSRM